MLHGYVVTDAGTVREVTNAEELQQAVAAGCGRIWVDILADGGQEVADTGRILGLHADAVRDATEGEPRPRIDEFDDHIFLIMYGAVGPEEPLVFSPRKLAIFLTATAFVTVHDKPHRTIERLHRRFKTRSHAALEGGVDTLLLTIFDSIMDNYLLVSENFDQRVSELEEKSLDPKVLPDLLESISGVRGELLQMRRLASQHHEVLQPIAEGEIDLISPNLENSFAHVRDHITRTIETIDGTREILHGVRDNYQAALLNRTNHVIQTLTTFSTIFLPLTLLAGIYGMNTDLWPPADMPGAFWIYIGGMTAIGLGLYLYFRMRRFL